VASGALAAVVAGGYLGLMPLLSSSMNAAPAWPTPLEEVSSRRVVVANIGATPETAKREAPAATLVRVSPTSGAKVKARKPAIKTGPRATERRAVVGYEAPRASGPPAASSPAPAAAQPSAPVRRAAPAPAKRRPAPQPEAEIVPVDVPALAGGEASPPSDEDPGTAGSGG
jgi:hypothetical protein